MSSDPLDLPLRRDPQNPGRAAVGIRTELTAKQRDIVIQAQVDLLKDGMQLAKGIVDIVRVRHEAAAQVDKIDANTRLIVERIQAQVKELSARIPVIQAQGEVAQNIILGCSQLLKDIPDEDSASRGKLIDSIHKFIDSALEQNA